ncbi:MAG: sensor domain-containing diguanylate cyclase, partial [Curvibacter sp.]
MANKLDMADSAALVEHFSSLYEHSPLHVVLYDPQDMVRYANPAHCTDFGMARDVQMSWSDMMRHSYQNQVGAAINTDNLEAWLVSAKARRGKLPFRTFETDLRNGRWMYITETMDDQGWMLSVGFDITALRANDRSLRQARDGALRAAQVDALTGVSSRAHVLEQLDLRLNQLRSTQQPCGLVLVDLDYFKKINDTYGHTAGDEVLQRFSRLVVGTLGRNDGFGRIGGEEFLLLFPMVTAPEMEAKVQGILELVRESS